MTNLSPFLTIDSSCDKALQTTKKKLSQAGLLSVQTFNLNAVRLGLHSCSCPNHGTDDCDCQMIILLVYGEVAEPATLISHGNNGRTWISVADTALQHADAKLMTSIQHALESQVSADC